MEKRFSILRLIGTVYKVLGGIAAVLTLLSVVGFCLFTVLGGAASSSFGRGSQVFAGLLSSGIIGVISALLTLLYGGIASITLFGAGEAIFLMIALEENTRTTAQLLQQQMQHPPFQTPPPPMSPPPSMR
jgi:hypothetical protein